MKRPLAVCAALLAATGLSPAAAQSGGEGAIERALARVVVVRAAFEGAPNLGAGLLLGRDQDRLYLVTANHVVRRGASVAPQVQLSFKTQPGLVRAAQVLPHHDAELDIAVLAVDAVRPRDVDLCTDAFYILDSENIGHGTRVLPLGHPNGVRWMVPPKPDALVAVEGDELLFQSNILSPGHSGGALMSADANWLGMLTADSPPLGRAVSAMAILRKLVEWKLPVLIHDSGFLNLLKATEDGDIAALARWLLVCDPNKWGSDAGPKYREFGLKLPLDVAVRARRSAVVRTLLAGGANPNVRVGREGTLLHVAVFRSTTEIVGLLLAAGATPNVTTLPGEETPLMWAAKANRLEVARALLDAGADANAVSKAQETALGLSRKHPAMQQLLRERGATGPADGAVTP